MSEGAWPVELRLRRASRTLDVVFDDGMRASLSAERLRRMTPSAAERGHGGPSTDPLPGDFSGVRLFDVRPVGRYAVRLVFDDGHDSGLYTWGLLHALARGEA